MRILTRYLLRAHTGPFVFALSILTGLLFVNTVAKRFPSLAGKGLPVSVILKVMGLSLPHIVALTLPMAVLVAVLYAFSQLAADNEVTAMKASGVSLLRLLVPLVVTSTLLAAFMVWFNDRVLPETNHQLAELMMDINSKSPTLLMKDRGVLNEIPTVDYSTHYWLRAQRIDVATNKLTDVVIYDVSNPDISQTVIADSGQMLFNRDRTDLFLTLYDGRVDQVKRQTPQDIDRVFFKQQLVQLKFANPFQRTTDNYRSDREMSLAMLQARIDTAQNDLDLVKRGIVPAGDTSRTFTQGLPGPGGLVGHSGPVTQAETQERINTLQSQVNSYSVEWHKKFAIPFACIIFVLIGAPLAVRFPRGGVGMVISISLLIFGIYYVSLIGGESLGDKGDIPAFLGPWAPNFFFGAIGLIAALRIGRETSTTRGGGWDDLRSTVTSLVTRPFRRRS
jgi:lipopolysaccharide export system permease protein